MASFKVGPVGTPDGTVYYYRVAGVLSYHRYANAASARAAASKPQRLVRDGSRVVPRDEPESALAAVLEP
jgi:hypothetical protein